ncbi:MAG: protease-associated PA domain-containing protein, partial [Anaerolineales bacterium]
TFDPADSSGTVAIQVVIPAGSTYARFSLFDADVTPGTDLDLYVYQGSSLVGSSGGGTSAEEVNFTFTSPTASPTALTVYVHGWGVAGGTSSPFALYAWYLGSTAAGNMTVTAPASATLGATGTIDLSFNGLASGTKYLGSVAYSGAQGMPSPTIVRVDVP